MTRKFTIQTTDRAEKLRAQLLETIAARDEWEGEKLQALRLAEEAADSAKAALLEKLPQSAKELQRWDCQYDILKARSREATEKRGDAQKIVQGLEYSAGMTAEALALELFRANFSQIDGTQSHYKAVRDFLEAIADSLKLPEPWRCGISFEIFCNSFSLSVELAEGCHYIRAERDPRAANTTEAGALTLGNGGWGTTAENLESAYEYTKAGLKPAEVVDLVESWRSVNEQLRKAAQVYDKATARALEPFRQFPAIYNELANSAKVRIY